MSDTATQSAVNRDAMKGLDEVAISITDMNKWFGTFRSATVSRVSRGDASLFVDPSGFLADRR
jgi:general L-amino acid transport system ATP-binding protein